MSAHPISSRVTTVVVGLLAGVLALSVAVPGASARPQLTTTDPADGAQLETSPTEIRLIFSEAVDSDTTVTVACNNTPAPVGPSRVAADGETVVVPVIGVITTSKCNVAWNVPTVTDDITGVFSFDVLADAAPSTTAAPGATDISDLDASSAETADAAVDAASNGSSMGIWLWLARIVSYVGLLALFGALVLIARAWPEGVEYAVTERYLRVVWIAAIVGTAGHTILLTADVGDRSLGSSVIPTAWLDLFDTSAGVALLARLALVIASGWVVIQPERVLDFSSRLTALSIPGLAVATWGFSRTGGDMALIGIPVGVLHALAAAVWFGGIMLLARVVLLGPGEEDLVHAVRGYVRYSTAALVLTVITGAVQTYRLDSGALLSSSHGRLLILKVLAVAAMAYLMMALRPVVRARLERASRMDGRTASRLRRALSAEMLLGLVVLAFTSWLLAVTPDNVEARSSGYAVDTGRSGGDLDVRVLLTSDRVGQRSGVRIELYAPESEVTNLTVSFIPPDSSPSTSGTELTVPLEGAGAAELPAAQGITFAAPGDWTIEVDADGPEGGLLAVTETVTIGD
jgi:copper transport protein